MEGQQRPPRRPERAPRKTPAERAEEFAEVQRRLKREAGERRAAAADRDAKKARGGRKTP